MAPAGVFLGRAVGEGATVDRDVEGVFLSGWGRGGGEVEIDWVSGQAGVGFF